MPPKIPRKTKAALERRQRTAPEGRAFKKPGSRNRKKGLS